MLSVREKIFRSPKTARSASESLISLWGVVAREISGRRAPASKRGLTALALRLGARLPAIVEVGFAVLPTYNPLGKFPALLLLDPFPSTDEPAELPGAPDAPRCPS